MIVKKCRTHLVYKGFRKATEQCKERNLYLFKD